MTRKFSTGYDLWNERGLGPDLYAESVSPLATKIVDRELAQGVKVLGEHAMSSPLFLPGVGNKRMTNAPGPLYRADEQILEEKLKAENQAKWDALNVPEAHGLPGFTPGESTELTELPPILRQTEAGPTEDIVTKVSNFVSERPVESALLGILIYSILSR